MRPQASPVSARLTAWGSAVLAGEVSPDLAAERVAADGAVQRVADPSSGDVASLPVALARLRTAGSTGLALLLPVPGDPVGLDPASAGGRAGIAAGEAVGVLGPGGPQLWVPAGDDAVLTWHRHPWVGAGPLVGLDEAEQLLGAALRDALDALAEVAVAPLSPVGEGELDALRAGGADGDGLAPGYPPRAHRVLVRARRVRGAVGLAAAEHTRALSLGEAQARRRALHGVDHAARVAEMAAHNCLAVAAAARA